MSRPEEILPPDLYYDDAATAKYKTSSRLRSIQTDMTHRALELLSLPHSSLVLDIGCGTGLSGSILSDTESHGHTWVGIDISASMLTAALEREDIPTGSLLLGDMGQGLGMFRPGTFDGAISISAIQWLCAAEDGIRPETRLKRFFDGLYASLRRGGRAVCQFYPGGEATGKSGIEKRRMIEAAAVKAGFGAGVLEDDPGTKNGKLYLVLSVGGGRGDITSVVNGMEGVDVMDQRRKKAGRKGRGGSGGGRGGVMKRGKHRSRR